MKVILLFFPIERTFIDKSENSVCLVVHALMISDSSKSAEYNVGHLLVTKDILVPPKKKFAKSRGERFT